MRLIFICVRSSRASSRGGLQDVEYTEQWKYDVSWKLRALYYIHCFLLHHLILLSIFCALVENAIFSFLKLQSREKWRSLKVVVFFLRKRRKEEGKLAAEGQRTFVIFQSECKCDGAYILRCFITNFTWRVGQELQQHQQRPQYVHL